MHLRYAIQSGPNTGAAEEHWRLMHTQSDRSFVGEPCAGCQTRPAPRFRPMTSNVTSAAWVWDSGCLPPPLCWVGCRPRAHFGRITPAVVYPRKTKCMGGATHSHRWTSNDSGVRLGSDWGNRTLRAKMCPESTQPLPKRNTETGDSCLGRIDGVYIEIRRCPMGLSIPACRRRCNIIGASPTS